MKCPNCNEEVTSRFCSYCGSEMPKEQNSKTVNGNVIINNYYGNLEEKGAKKAKNKWISFLLCLFLGIFGFHKFYEGKIAMGIIYLFTVGFFGIGWFVDCIIILLKPNPYYI